MHDELLRLDLTDSVPSIEVPVLFFLGRYDRHAEARVAAAYFWNTLRTAKAADLVRTLGSQCSVRRIQTFQCGTYARDPIDHPLARPFMIRRRTSGCREVSGEIR